MPRIGIKKPYFFYGESGKKNGFNLNKWFINTMNYYGIPVDDNICCDIKKNHLYIQKGYVQKNKSKSKQFFNLDKWLGKELVAYGLISNNLRKTMCCNERGHYKIFSDTLYFDGKGTLNIWLHDLIVLAGYEIDDPSGCC